MKKLAGIDLGGTNIKFGLFSREGALLKKWYVSTDLRENGRFLWKQIGHEIKKMRNLQSWKVSAWEFRDRCCRMDPWRAVLICICAISIRLRKCGNTFRE